MPVQTHRTRQNSRGEITRAQVLDAALRLFSRYGYDETTVRAVGRACGVSDAALYHYFKSKRQLLEAIFEEQWKVATADRIDALTPAPMTSQRLLEIADVTVQAIAQQDELIRLLNRQALADDAAARHLRSMRVSAWRQSLLRQFDSRFLPADAATLVDSFTWFILGTVVSVQVKDARGFAGASTSPEFRDQLHRAVLRAVPIERYARC